MSVRTADGTSRAALRPSRHAPSTCWSVPASRCVRASSSTMNGTPSDWACIAAADAASTGPPRMRFRSSAVSTELNRPGRSRRTRPIRSMSATKFTASVTDANSSGRIVSEQEDRPLGVAPDHVAEKPERVVVRPLDVVDEQGERADAGRAPRSPRPRGRTPGGALASGERVSNPGSSRPEIASDHPSDRGLRRRPRGRVADRARREQAARDEERPPDLLVGRDRDAREAAGRRASSAAASSRRVLPIPGSPSRVTAARRPEASRSSWEIASSSALRPMTAPVARRSWTASEHWGPTSGSSAPPSTTLGGAPCSTDVGSPSMLRSMTCVLEPISRDRVLDIHARLRERPGRPMGLAVSAEHRRTSILAGLAGSS